MNICLCGCGQKVVKRGNKYIFNHHGHTKLYWEKHLPKFIKCACGCGQERLEFDKWGRKKIFINEHANRNKIRSEETRKLISKNRKGKYCGVDHYNYGSHFSDETRQKMRDNHADISGENNPFYGKKHSDEVKQKLSDSLSGELHYNWKGGVSKEPYCHIWSNWLKKEIKERDDFKCQNPDCNKEVTNKNTLSVHHIDYNKKNCSCDNLITLCRSCNSHSNHNRDYWKEFYSNILSGIN